MQSRQACYLSLNESGWSTINSSVSTAIITYEYSCKQWAIWVHSHLGLVKCLLGVNATKTCWDYQL